MKHLHPIAEKVILTKADNPRAVEPEDLALELADICEKPMLAPDLSRALEIALDLAEPDDLVCITGSVYLAGEAMQMLGTKADD